MNTSSFQPESTPPNRPVRLTRVALLILVLVILALIAGDRTSVV